MIRCRCLYWYAAILLFDALACSVLTAAPLNDNFLTASNLGSASSIDTSQTLAGATHEAGEPVHAGRLGSGSVWWTWTAPAAGTVEVSTIGSNVDTLLAVYQGPSLSALTLLASADDRLDLDVSFEDSILRFRCQAGAVYHIAVDFVPLSPTSVPLGELRLNFQVPPSNDDFNTPTDLGTDQHVTGIGTTVGAFSEPGEPGYVNPAGKITRPHLLSRVSIPAEATVWWTWTAPADGTAKLTLIDHFVGTAYVFTGNQSNALDPVTSLTIVGQVAFVPGVNDQTSFTVTKGTQYRILVATSDWVPIKFAIDSVPSGPLPDISGSWLRTKHRNGQFSGTLRVSGAGTTATAVWIVSTGIDLRTSTRPSHNPRKPTIIRVKKLSIPDGVTVKARLDPENVIAESDETNNDVTAP